MKFRLYCTSCTLSGNVTRTTTFKKITQPSYFVILIMLLENHVVNNISPSRAQALVSRRMINKYANRDSDLKEVSVLRETDRIFQS